MKINDKPDRIDARGNMNNHDRKVYIHVTTELIRHRIEL